MGKKRWAAALAALLRTLPLGGCQLAVEAKNAGQDRLVGALVTLEPLDLSGMAARAEGDGDEANGDDGADADRLYAVEQDGEYRFDGVKGDALLCTRETSEGGETINAFSGAQNGWLTDLHQGITSRDDGEALSLEATLCLTDDNADAVLYLNPIYQGGDGRVYATKGNSCVYPLEAEGELGSFSIDEAVEVVENGKKRTRETTVKIRVRTQAPAESVTVLWMSGDNRVIDRATYDAGAMPDALTVGKDAQYMMVESRCRGGAGSKPVRRALAQRGDAYLETFVDAGNGLCAARQTELTWE